MGRSGSWAGMRRFAELGGSARAPVDAALVGDRQATAKPNGSAETAQDAERGGETRHTGPPTPHPDNAEDQPWDRPSDEGGQAPRPHGRNAAEWTTLAVSFVVVAALVGAALFEYYARSEPAGTRVGVELAIDQAQRRGDLYYVPYTVRNAGTAPAEAVVVVFEVRQGEEVVEESTAEIAFLPTSGSADGELVTALDPAAHQITARVATLQRP